MPRGTPAGDSAYADSMFASLTAGAQDRPESRVLDPLVGTWRTTTTWEPIVGHGVRTIEGRLETQWIHGGRVLRSCSSASDGTPTGDLILAFDGLVGDYIAFAFNSLSTFFVVERGPFDPGVERWDLEALEPRRDGEPAVRFRRTIQLQGPDAFTVAISYPDAPPDTYGPMSISHDRVR